MSTRPARTTGRENADAGAGSVLALAIVGAIAVAAIGGAALGSALTVRQRVEAAADAAALAAADTAVGFVAGDPCEVAARVVAADGARLADCTADGLVLTVTVVGSAAGIPITARATAGPPS